MADSQRKDKTTSNYPFLVVGLTGSIGSGKSTAADIFKSLGCAIVDADELSHQVTDGDSEAIRAVREQFGAEYIDSKGSIDRKRLGSLVFREPEKRRLLESIVHPRIRSRWLQILNEFSSSSEAPPTAGIIIYVVPLLFESGITYSELKKTILVAAPDESCIARVTSRSGLSRAEAESRLRSQMPTSEKRKKVDFVIENDGDLEKLRKEVGEVFKRLRE